MEPRPPPTPALSYADYLRFSQLAHQLYGLNFPEKRRVDLEQGVKQAYAASGCHSLDEYYQRLTDPDRGKSLRQQLANTLTIGESHFFRDAGQFNALYDHVLPELIEQRRSLRMLRIWSAGCSSGEEPYSLAIMLRELIPDIDQWTITIQGTDINSGALERARRGLYSEWAFRENRAIQWRNRYFRPVDKHYELLPEIRRMVHFMPLNLVEDDYPSLRTNTTYLDLIICRNVTIYFTPTITRRIIERFYEALVDGGWLIVGHSEHSLLTYRQFQARNFTNAILYRRIPATAPLTDTSLDWLNEPGPEPDPVWHQPLPKLKLEAALPDLPIEEPPLPKPGELLSEAKRLIESHQSEQARTRLMQLVEQHTHQIEASALLGQVNANLGNWSEAENWCRQAIRLDNLAENPYYTLALILEHTGRLEEAVQSMKKVVYINSASIRGHYGLANLYNAQGKIPQALKALTNVEKLLSACRDNDTIPGTDGMTANALRQAVQLHQQQWSAANPEKKN